MSKVGRVILLQVLSSVETLAASSKWTWRSSNVACNGGYVVVEVKPLSHQTVMPRCLYSVLKSCQRAVGSPRNTPKISNLSVIACTQRPHSVPTASTRRSHSVFTASMTFSQSASSCCSVSTARTRRTHSVLTAHTQRPHGDYSV